MGGLNRLSDTISDGEKYGPAMAITTAEEAAAYFELLVEHCMRRGNDREEAEEIERDALGYFAGYFSDAVRARVESLFKCKHPVFGAIAEKGPPTAKQAFEVGIRLGQRLREAL